VSPEEGDAGVSSICFLWFHLSTLYSWLLTFTVRLLKFESYLRTWFIGAGLKIYTYPKLSIICLEESNFTELSRKFVELLFEPKQTSAQHVPLCCHLLAHRAASPRSCDRRLHLFCSSQLSVSIKTSSFGTQIEAHSSSATKKGLPNCLFLDGNPV
jgi:hypothetical protein